MPKPRRDPYVAVDATIRRNAKLAALPSDTARLGWLYVGLGDAKLQRPAGRFASRAHWAEVAGRFGRYLGDYLSVGLLEEWPNLCDRCRAAWGELPAGALIVHDWKRHQTDPGAAERAEAWRENDDRTANDAPLNEEGSPTERGLNGLSRARVRDPAGSRAANRKRREERERSESQAPTAVPARKAGQPSRNGAEPRLTRAQFDAWATFGPEWEPFKAAWLARGFRHPPAGSPDDDDTSQRGLLWQVLDRWPTEIARWVRDAPGRTPREVVDHVLARWHETRAEAGDDVAWLDDSGRGKADAAEALGSILARLGTEAPA